MPIDRRRSTRRSMRRAKFPVTRRERWDSTATIQLAKVTGEENSQPDQDDTAWKSTPRLHTTQPRQESQRKTPKRTKSAPGLRSPRWQQKTRQNEYSEAPQKADGDYSTKSFKYSDTQCDEQSSDYENQSEHIYENVEDKEHPRDEPDSLDTSGVSNVGGISQPGRKRNALMPTPQKRAPPRHGAFCCHVVWPVIGILGFLLDIGSDIALAIEYYSEGHFNWFALTLTFVLVPNMAMTVFSLILWVRDVTVLKEKVSACRWFFRILSSLLFTSLIMRLVDMVYYSYQSRNRLNDRRRRAWYYKRMLDEHTDICLVRLFETFLENAPQLVLQLYIMKRIGTEDGLLREVLQCLSLVTSWLFMSWSLVGFNMALRDSLPTKASMTFSGKLAMFLWRLLTIASRVIAMALFASHFRFYVLVFAGIHFVFMFFWMTNNNSIYCVYRMENEEDEDEMAPRNSLLLEYIFRAMGAFVHIFCFFNLIEGHTRLRCIFFYTLTYMENIALILLWYFYGSHETDFNWYHIPAIVMVIGGFFLGILFQILYYKCCHPNNFSPHHKAIKTCISCKDLTFFGAPSFTGEHWEFPWDHELLYEPLPYRSKPHDPSIYKGDLPITPNLSLRTLQNMAFVEHNAMADTT